MTARTGTSLLGGSLIAVTLVVALAPAPLMATELGSVQPRPRPPGLVPAALDQPAPGDDTPALAAPEPVAAAAPAAAPAPAGGVAKAPAPAKAAPAPRDPNRGSVTNLPLPRYVSLKGKEGNARRGPGLTHRIDWVFTRAGMPLKITAEHEHWRRIEDAEGAGGWVHYSLLSGVRSVLVTEDMAEAHSRPEDGAEVAFKVERNVVGWVQECLPDWCRVSMDGERGWLRKDVLWGVDPGETVE